MKSSIIITLSLIASLAHADDAFHHHRFKTGEMIQYDYEDSDTVFAAVLQDGTIQAGDAIKVQEIKIPVGIKVQSQGKGLVRKLTILPLSQYRASPLDSLAQTPFESLTKLIKNLQPSFAYSYKDDTDALNNLQKTFESIRKDKVGGFLFFKIQDIHQMLESTEHIPEGITPGQTHSSPRNERKGLGGKFIVAPGQLIYHGTEIFDGIRSGYFKVISLGHQFSLPEMKTYTNFFFTMHVALEGPDQGLLLFGEGQETATVLKGTDKGNYQPQALLQRQFSIRLHRPQTDR